MCTVDQGKEVSKKSNKEQGKKAKPAQKGYQNPIGMGEAFVGAVQKAQEEMKGSKTSFLGQSPIIIDPKDYSHTLDNENQTQVKPEHCPAAPLWKGKGPNSRKGGKGKDYVKKEN
jgi:hypothetical protein